MFETAKSTKVCTAIVLAALMTLSISPSAADGHELPISVPLPCNCEDWVSYYERGEGNDRNMDIAVGPLGDRVYTTGWSTSDEGDFDYTTIAYSTTDGSLIWTSHFDGSAGGSDRVKSITISPTGDIVYVTGTSETTTGNDIVTVAYNAVDGSQLWASGYNGPGDGSDSASRMVVTADGATVIVTGSSQGTSSRDFATVAFDGATGEQLWSSLYNGPADQTDLATSIGASPDGSFVVVTGSSGGSTTSLDFATIAYDSSDGTELWAARFDGAAHNVDVPWGVTVSPDSQTVVVTGESRFDSGLDTKEYATIAYDAVDGSALWAALYNGPGAGGDSAVSLDVDPSGSMVVVTGSSAGLDSASGFATVAYDLATGAELWVARYDWLWNSNAADLTIAPDGSKVFVTGQSQRARIGAGGSGVSLSEWRDVQTNAYDTSDGSLAWSARYEDRSASIPLKLAVSPDGSQVFVGSPMSYAVGLDITNHMATLAYPADGPIV